MTPSYTPEAVYHGADTFDYVVTDGALTATASVSVTVHPVPDAPVAGDDAVTTAEDAAVTVDVLANDTDVDGDILSVESVTQPAHGSVANNGSDVTYTPDGGYHGEDNFSYVVSDGVLTDTATVTITVRRVVAAREFYRACGFEDGVIAPLRIQ